MPAFLTLTLLKRIGPYLLVAALAAALVLWVSNLQSRLARAEASAKETAIALHDEQIARARDVAGLTTLARGTAAAAVETKRDTAILQETIGNATPQPASPALASFLDRLRQADTAAAVQRAAAGTGSAVGTTASGSH